MLKAEPSAHHYICPMNFGNILVCVCVCVCVCVAKSHNIGEADCTVWLATCSMQEEATDQGPLQGLRVLIFTQPL